MPGARSRKVLYRHSDDGKQLPGTVLPSKTDYIHVEPDDVLEWITWGGGGLGDPLTRPAEKVALEVHQRLVTIQGAKDNYGVIVNPDFSVNVTATDMHRDRLVHSRPKGAGEEQYNRGGTLRDLVKTCLEETGQQPPRPQWMRNPYGPHVALPYVREWYAKMKKASYEGWDI